MLTRIGWSFTGLHSQMLTFPQRIGTERPEV